MDGTCRTGLFVGVSEYRDLPPDKHLPGAASDALSMAESLRRADPDGVWRTVYDSPFQRPYRAEILDALWRMVHNVLGRDSGFFYFAGHALQTEGQLVMAPVDFRPAIPYDSGIPLSRIFQIFHSVIDRDARFLAMLDCCREGDHPRVAGDIPENVTVLYACPPGRQALGNRRGGLLTTAFQEALADRSRGKKQHRSVSELFPFIEKNWRRLAPKLEDGPILRANSAAEILLPVPPTQRRRKRSPYLSGSLLTTGTIKNLRMAQHRLDEIRGLLSDWFGIEPDDEPVATMATLRQVSDEGQLSGVRIEVALTGDAFRWTAGELVQHLLEEYNLFQDLSVRWSATIPEAIFREFAKRCDLTCDRAAGGQLILGWEHLPYQGRVYVESTGTEGTRVRVACLSPQADPIGLQYVGSRVPQLFDDLRDLELPKRS